MCHKLKTLVHLRHLIGLGVKKELNFCWRKLVLFSYHEPFTLTSVNYLVFPRIIINYLNAVEPNLTQPTTKHLIIFYSYLFQLNHFSVVVIILNRLHSILPLSTLPSFTCQLLTYLHILLLSFFDTVTLPKLCLSM